MLGEPERMIAMSPSPLDRLLNRDAFYDVSRHFSLTAVVKTSGSGIGMPSQILYVLKRNSLAEQVSDRGHAKRMRGEPLRKSSLAHSSLDHAAHVSRRHWKLRELLGSPHCCPKEGSVFVGVLQTTGDQVVPDVATQIVSDRNLA